MVGPLKLGAILASCIALAAHALELNASMPENDASLTSSVSMDSTNGCKALTNAGLASLLLYPSDAAYTEREASYWAVNAALGPLCIVQPRNTNDVSRVVKVLSECNGNTKFAVRSGGHMQWAGASDIQGGVTVDLGLMTAVTYNAQTKIVSIQPGPKWGAVYAALEPYNVVVTGGRDADVGVAGFLTGGGNSFYTGRTGFGCDTVVNFEVVLASGTVVNANKWTNPDLWKALKGGQGNFGIVTRFDIESRPAHSLWGGMAVHNVSAASQLSTALVNFNNQNSEHPDDAHLILATYNSYVPLDTIIASVIVDTQGVVNGSTFAEIQSIPAIQSTYQTSSIREITEAFVTPGGRRVVWYTLTFNNDAAIAQKALELHDQVISDLKASLGASTFYTQCILQPIPQYFATNGVKKGGNMLGLDSVKGNSILWLGSVAYSDQGSDQLVHDKVGAWSSDLEAFAQSRNGGVAWRYINYADGTQNPLKSYGKANVDFIKRVAAKYDPTAVFQQQVPSGFKISRA